MNKARIMTAVRVAVSAALIAWILRKAPLGEVLDAFRSADLRFVLLAVAMSPLGYVSSVSRWRLLLRSQGGDATFWFLVKSFAVGIFFNNLLPSTIGGDAIRAYDTSRSGVGRAAAVAIVVVDRFIGLLALMLFAGVGLLLSYLWSGRLTDEVPELYGWVAGGAIVLGLIAALLFLPWSRPSKRAPDLLARLGPRFKKVSDAIFAFQGKGAVLAKAFGWSLFLQTVVVLNGWLLAKALHVPIPLPYFFLIVPIAVFVMMIPVSINAIGVRENVWAFFFTAFGVASAKGVAVAWLDYGLVLIHALIGGAIYAWSHRPSKRAPAEPVAEEAVS
ncbi:MAG TPA: lysylphosphatidylglycerol synthase transmembrane domain-containing protein [Thermoanaerobaculia bacterium]|nr:lysylphosphatidylglycerol synthase transmembrane domain-containing protein [Thermoanaerobaculia bacterium]